MDFLRAAITAGATPQISASGATVLRQGRQFKILVTSAGALTATGKLYDDETITALATNAYATGQIPRR